jgi:aminocarboxymuconate-semialdehyde decarboxylase
MNWDVHTHLVPTELLELLAAEGAGFGVEVFKNESGDPAALIGGRVKVGPFPSYLTDIPARLAAMDAARVDRQIISCRTDLAGYALDAGVGARYGRALNRTMADVVARYPDRFVALGTAPLQAPAAAAEELAFAVQELGLAGVEIASNVNGIPLDQLDLTAFWEAANELRCIVLLHPADPPLPGLDLERYFLHNMVGRPAETTVALAGLLFGGVLEKYPDLVILLVHGGGFIPYQMGRMNKGYHAVPRITQQHITRPPEEMVKRLYFDSLLHSPQALAFLVGLVGADHVMAGSDYPYHMADRDPVGSVEAVPGLGEGDRSLILEGNILRLLAGIRR